MINKQPAIYRLIDRETGECYVGGTKNAQGRKRQHEYDLRSTRHGNPKLQQAYLDGTRFEFDILEYLPLGISDDSIVRREQKWIDLIKPFYNSRMAIPKFGSDLYIEKERKMSSKRTTPQTEEEKRKRAESVKKYWETHPHRVLTAEEKNVISQRVRGENHPRWGKKTPEERKNRISEGVSKIEYTFSKPDGSIVIFRNMKKFCLDNSLPVNSLRNAIKSGANYKGWSFLKKEFLGYKKDR